MTKERQISGQLIRQGDSSPYKPQCVDHSEQSILHNGAQFQRSGQCLSDSVERH